MKISVHASQPFVHTPSLPAFATMSLPPTRPQEQVVAPKPDPVPEPTPESSTGKSEKQWILEAALAVSDRLHSNEHHWSNYADQT